MLKNTKETFIDNITKIQNAQTGDTYFVSDDIDDYQKREKCFILIKNKIYFGKEGNTHADLMQKIKVKDTRNYILGNVINDNNVSIQEIIENDDFVELENFSNIVKYIPKLRKHFLTENIFFSTYDLEHNNYFLTKIA